MSPRQQCDIGTGIEGTLGKERDLAGNLTNFNVGAGKRK